MATSTIKSEYVVRNVSGTTDANGFLATGLSNIIFLWADNLIINGVAHTTAKRPVYLSNGGIKFVVWNDTVIAQNSSVSFDVYYMPR